MGLHVSSLDARLYIHLHHDPATCNAYSILECLVLFAVARSTIRGFPTAAAIENTASLAKRFGGNSGKLIHVIAVEVSSSGLNEGLHMSGLI
ncbi:hypothetical protein RND71_042375 [Anisodus tanguticus]|uniref:Uncharacterized protein n=1 Tax=Anisodus tanguticus TaxID=243964 RepID=A0AAE1QQS5_9SOLA|nr:hypothetical protein RND71_042375 [Anisodus tanguticus]